MREHPLGRRAVLRAVAAVRRLWARLTRRNDDSGVSLTRLLQLAPLEQAHRPTILPAVCMDCRRLPVLASK